MTHIYITKEPLTLKEFESIAVASGFTTAWSNEGSYPELDVYDKSGECVVWRAFENHGNDGHSHIEGSGWDPRFGLDVWEECGPEYRVLIGDIDEFIEDEGERFSPNALDDLFLRVGVERD